MQLLTKFTSIYYSVFYIFMNLLNLKKETSLVANLLQQPRTNHIQYLQVPTNNYSTSHTNKSLNHDTQNPQKLNQRRGSQNLKSLEINTQTIFEINMILDQDQLKEIQIPQNAQSRIALTETISNLISSRTSQFSDLSLRSEIIDLKTSQSSSFKYKSELVSHNIKIFQQSSIFKREFMQVIQHEIKQIYRKTSGCSENFNFQFLFQSLRKINMEHPFKIQNSLDYMKITTPQILLDQWLSDYQNYFQMILSFDFLFSHTSFIIILIFNWIKLSQYMPNPLITKTQGQIISVKRDKTRINILKVLYDYIHYRSRQIINNILIQQLLNQFCKYLNKNLLTQNQQLQKYHNQFIAQLGTRLQMQALLKQKINIGQSVMSSHLDFIYDRYQNKDKFIQESLADQAALFMEIDLRNFINTPLNRYYQTGQESQSSKILAEHHSLLTCWILNLVLKKCKTDGWTALIYCQRFFQLCKLLFLKRNYERTVFFINIIWNIKSNLPNLWIKFMEKMNVKNGKVNETIDKMFSQIQRLALSTATASNDQYKNNNEVIIFPEIKIHKIVLSIKQKHKQKGGINLSLHENIQIFAKKIIYYRQMAQKHFLDGEEDKFSNRTIKMNLNYRFLNNYIFEILGREKSDIEQFEGWKLEAKNINGCIAFPSKFWNIF